MTERLQSSRVWKCGMLQYNLQQRFRCLCFQQFCPLEQSADKRCGSRFLLLIESHLAAIRHQGKSLWIRLFSTQYFYFLQSTSGSDECCGIGKFPILRMGCYQQFSVFLVGNNTVPNMCQKILISADSDSK